MPVFNFHETVVSSKFPVQSPGYFLFRLYGDVSRFKRMYQICIIFLRQNCRQYFLQFQRIFRLCNKSDFKQSVIHIHILSCKIFKPSHRPGIGNHSEHKIILLHTAPSLSPSYDKTLLQRDALLPPERMPHAPGYFFKSWSV